MKNLIIIITLILPGLMYAQDTLITESDTIITNTGVIEVDQVEVIKAFEAKLMDAKKIYLKPDIKPIIPVEKVYDYNITIVPLRIDYPDPVIKPLAMNPDPAKSSKRFFSRLGYGDLNSPYADISYHHQRGDEFDYTIAGHYYGADDSEVVKYRKFSEAALNINGGYRLGENHKLNIDLGGGYDQRNMYDTLNVNTLELTEEDVKRNVLRTRIKAGISNIEPTDANFNYGFNLTGKYIDFSEFDSHSQRDLTLDAFVDNRISSNLTIFLAGDITFYSFSSEGSTNSWKSYNANPGLRLSIGNFQLDAAAELYLDANKTSFFPSIKASYSLLDNSLQIFGGVDQQATMNTLWNHYMNNPFVCGFVPYENTTVSQHYFGGLSGIVKDFLSFSFEAGYADVEDQFYYDYLDDFSLHVKNADMTNIFINANIEFNVTKNVSLGANVSQNFYSPKGIDILPNIPEYSYSGYSKIKLLNDKLVVSADLNLIDRIAYIDKDFNNELGNTQIDFSLGVDLFFTDNIGLWIRGNNLLDREYLRFNNYPEFGRNLLGGLLVKF